MNKIRTTAGLLLAICVLALAAVAQDGLPKQINGGVLNGKATSLPVPVYPSEAKAAGLEGTVFVDVSIDESGTVISAIAATEPRKVSRSKDGEAYVVDVPVADQLLRDAAEQAAMQARFSPVLLSGNPVKVKGTIVYNFVANPETPSEPAGVDGGVLNGKAVSLPLPRYPAAARAVKAEGAVTVKITIDEGGQVIAATALSGHPLLRAAAVDAARNAIFAPTLVNGQTTKVSGVLTYNFVGPTEN